MTLSAAGLGRLRRRLPGTLLISDDMQMQGLQKALGTPEASLQSLKAGMDCSASATICSTRNGKWPIQDSLRDSSLSGPDIADSIARVGRRKAL